MGEEYSGLTRAELLARCKERGLSGAGTNPDLIQRLREWDAQQAEDDPLGLDDEPAQEPVPETPPAAGAASLPLAAGGPEPEPVSPVEPVEPAVEPAVEPTQVQAPTTFRQQYTIGDRALDDGYHFALIEETQRAARAAGLEPKGGVGIGSRVGYGVDDHGARTVTYEVPLRRRR